MKVLKFGGTSVGKPERMQSVARLISDSERKLVVLSAVSGTTNKLVDISDKLLKKDKPAAAEAIENLFGPYQEFLKNLYSTEEALNKGKEIIEEHHSFIKSLLEKKFTEKEERQVLAQGELISTKLFHEYLQEQGKKSVLLPALEFMKTDENSEPVLPYIEENLQRLIDKYPDNLIFVTQGYICKNDKGEIDNLKRGGSDYTASLAGAAIRAEEVQIWTDISGMHNNDPRIVKRTFPISELTFDEAAELAYFGAKILHPSTILPAKKYNIPVRLLNTMEPEAKGTVIANQSAPKEVKAIAAKDNIIAIKIKSARMLLAYGFLKKVFEIFEKYKTPIDMITTSEVAVSLTIDNDKHLEQIKNELQEFCWVEVETEQSIICIVGDFLAEKKGIVRKIFDSLEDVPVRMISYGGSKNNISILVKTEQKNEALNLLNEGLFFQEEGVNS
ncbi:aspartate kinase [Cytophagaceae bacterium ABcell3]|nr:aspartate kinase [Cytophagaceae bacterium ABcell3]